MNLHSAIFELCRLDDSNKELCPGDVRDTTTILEKLQALDPATDEARRVIAAIADLDSFNWGYDPVLYNVPEGSYATDPAGPARIREMRAMYQALHGLGLRVVMDVVYNHTSDEGADRQLLRLRSHRAGATTTAATPPRGASNAPAAAAIPRPNTP